MIDALPRQEAPCHFGQGQRRVLYDDGKCRPPRFLGVDAHGASIGGAVRGQDPWRRRHYLRAIVIDGDCFGAHGGGVDALLALASTHLDRSLLVTGFPKNQKRASACFVSCCSESSWVWKNAEKGSKLTPNLPKARFVTFTIIKF